MTVTVQPGTPLTPRERQIIDLLADGLVTKQIAARLGIAPSTAHTHLSNAYVRLGVVSAAGAVGVVLRAELKRNDPTEGRAVTSKRASEKLAR